MIVSSVEMDVYPEVQQMMPRQTAGGIKKDIFSNISTIDTIRVFDVCFSITGLILLSPFFLLIALLVKCSSKGPVIFSQQRVGKNGVDFTVYKFRTMCENA